MVCAEETEGPALGSGAIQLACLPPLYCVDVVGNSRVTPESSWILHLRCSAYLGTCRRGEDAS